MNEDEANDDETIRDERKIPIRIFDKKRFLGTVTVTMVTYTDGTAKLFDDKGECVAIGESKNGT